MTETDDNSTVHLGVQSNKSLVLHDVKNLKLESSVKAMEEFRIKLEASDFDGIIGLLTEKAFSQRAQGEIRSAVRLDRRISALKFFRDHGFDPAKMILPAILPEGYCGKILLAALYGGAAHGLVCIRSGDEWHREILRNTEEEIRDLGFENAIVNPAGGAFVRFNEAGAVIIYGSSDEYGECDKQLAADLIGTVFPEKRIIIDGVL